MGYKAVCFNCRKAFNFNAYADNPVKCPECAQPLALINQKFKPPKKSDVKSWEVAQFLYDNGFPYHHVYKDVSKNLRVNANSNENFVEYPTNMKDAKAFIETYKDQAHK